MTPEQFLVTIENAYAREYTLEQRRILLEQIDDRYNQVQLDQIFKKVISVTKFLPNFAEITDCALELGFEQHRREWKEHVWRKTDCALCQGEGMLSAFVEFSYQRDNAGKEYKRSVLVALVPASSERAMMRTEGFEYKFRCSCPAGNVKTLPESWPVWGRFKTNRIQK